MQPGGFTMADSLTEVARLRSILLQAADAVSVAGQALARALNSIEHTYPQLGWNGRIGQPPDGRDRAGDDRDDEAEQPSYDDLSGALAEALALLHRGRQARSQEDE
jgi:hypothetical protein